MGRKTDYAKVREQDRRDKISITRCLDKLLDIETELETNDSGMNVPALRLRTDISLNLLKKRLPDLKAIEHSGSIGDKPLEEMTDGDLAGELAKIRKLTSGDTRKTQRKTKPTIVH